MKHFIKCIFLCAFIFFSGCTVKKTVRVDIAKFTKDQASYIDEDVIITATLEDVVSRYYLPCHGRCNHNCFVVKQGKSLGKNNG